MENWKNINEHYMISDKGRVKSLDYTKEYFYKGKPVKRPKNGKILAISDNGRGYKKISIRGVGQKYIHRLVAEHFIDNPENKTWVNHKDGDKSNNCIENLEWSTPSENQIHAKDNGLNPVGEKHGSSKLTNEQVSYIREVYIPRHKEFGCNSLARKFGVSGSTICVILQGKSRKRG